LLLTDLVNLGRRLFRPPPARQVWIAERQVLTVPVHEYINMENKQAEIQAVLAKAAEQIASSGLIWKWVSTNGSVKLCYWDKAQMVFLRGSLTDWQFFFGSNWRVKDTNGQEYLGPSPVVTDRLIAAVLNHPATAVATWALQLKMKREAITK